MIQLQIDFSTHNRTAQLHLFDSIFKTLIAKGYILKEGRGQFRRLTDANILSFSIRKHDLLFQCYNWGMDQSKELGYWFQEIGEIEIANEIKINTYSTISMGIITDISELHQILSSYDNSTQSR